MELDKIQKNLLKQVADIENIPLGAFNIRINGHVHSRNNSANIEIIPKTDKSGIDIIIKSSASNERVDIPVLITKTGLKDLVYNDFFVEDNADVTIVAGCGIHNEGSLLSQHNGIHSFHIGKNAKVKYIEKHYGEGKEGSKRVLNPTTLIEMKENSYLEMDTSQIKGVDDTYRTTNAILQSKATLVINEKIMTNKKQNATTDFNVELNGEDCGTHIVSRAVAKDDSTQTFISCINGNGSCTGHTECDAIIIDNAKVSAIPKINAFDSNARLIHEATIGKIAGEQLIKLMSLGLSEQEAEEQIINGFLK